MKKITILSLFPQMVFDILSYGIIKRATKHLSIDSLDLRNWCHEGERVDDVVFGPGPGMLIKSDVVVNALKSINDSAYVIHMSPRGNNLTNSKAKELASKKHLVILASRYEGLDQRVINDYIDEEISIGDYILSGGELAVLVLIDVVIRMTGTILKIDAIEEESFQNGLLEYSHYTKPLTFENKTVPLYLRCGNHKIIKENRFMEQLILTWDRRPDLFCKYSLLDREINDSLYKIKKQNILLKKQLSAFEKGIQEYKDVRRTSKRRN